MAVVMTSPAFGTAVGDTFTGTATEEKWLKENGYARVDPPVALDEQYDVQPDEDLTLAANREDPGEPYEFGPGLENEPDVDSVAPAEGDIAGGTVVSVYGNDFTGVTAVTFGGTAGTALTVVDDNELTVTTPAHAAGAVDVVVTNPSGSDTLEDGFEYTDEA